MIFWIHRFIDNSDLDKKIATKAVLIVKLQAFNSILFCGKSNFEDADMQNYLVFQLVLRYLKKSSNSNYISGLKSK